MLQQAHVLLLKGTLLPQYRRNNAQLFFVCVCFIIYQVTWPFWHPTFLCRNQGIIMVGSQLLLLLLLLLLFIILIIILIIIIITYVVYVFCCLQINLDFLSTDMTVLYNHVRIKGNHSIMNPQVCHFLKTPYHKFYFSSSCGCLEMCMNLHLFFSTVLQNCTRYPVA